MKSSLQRLSICRKTEAQDATAAVVGSLGRGIDSHPGADLPHLAAELDLDADLVRHFVSTLQAQDRVRLLTSRPNTSVPPGTLSLSQGERGGEARQRS